VSEIERRQLHKEVENIMSDDSAAVLMRLLPPVGWNDFATKQDLETLGKFMQLGFNNSLLELRNEMNTEFAAVRSELHHEIDGLRKEMNTEFAAVRSEMNTEFAAVRSELHHEIDGLRKEMNAGFLDLRKEMNNQTHRMFMAMLGINTLLMSVAIAAFKLL
jgi:DNA anti-recombination protein RmuC